MAEEGMWTYEHFPTTAVQKRYGVKIDPAWLDHVRLSTLRLTTGFSGAVVSASGLAATNYHCVLDCVQAMTGESSKVEQQGFQAAEAKDEHPCPGMQAEIQVGATEVTEKVRVAADAAERDAVIARLEEGECGKDPILRCQVVPLYHGAKYMLYRFRKYTDVRLAFVPEFAIAFFGGDPDNFNFPRYDLDVAFIRLYRDGKPASTPEHLTFDEETPDRGQPVFVSGNPGGTERLITVSQMETERDVALPPTQLQRSEERGRLLQFAAESPEHKAAVAAPLFELENNFKAYFGRQGELADPSFIDIRRRQEADLRAKVAASAQMRQRLGDPWADMAKAQAAYAELFLRYSFLERGPGNMSDLYGYARTLVRAAVERSKPQDRRLREYGEARLPLVEKVLLDPQPVDPALETLYLSFWLDKTREYLGVDDPEVKALLGQDSPESLARRLVAGTKLSDPVVRQALWDGGQKAIDASDDPLIRFVAASDGAARRIRLAWEERVSGPSDEAAGRIAEANFELYGEAAYPDATFTPRITYGQVAGWTWRGTKVDPFTRFSGLYARATGADPFALPQRWIDARAKLDAETVFDLATSTDIIGGNSGSALIDAKGRMIGLVFDGNIHSLGGDYAYDGAVNRTVSLSAVAIGRALDKVYGDKRLLEELRGLDHVADRRGHLGRAGRRSGQEHRPHGRGQGPGRRGLAPALATSAVHRDRPGASGQGGDPAP